MLAEYLDVVTGICVCPTKKVALGGGATLRVYPPRYVSLAHADGWVFIAGDGLIWVSHQLALWVCCQKTRRILCVRNDDEAAAAEVLRRLPGVEHTFLKHAA